MGINLYLVNRFCSCGAIQLRVFDAVQEGCIKYIYCFTNSELILAFLGSFESFKIYLLGSSFSLLIGFFVVKQFKCGFFDL
jgi:hypothetical protein